MPYLGSTVFFVTVFGALFVALNGHFLLVRSLSPRFVEQTARSLRRRPIVIPLLGGIAGSAMAIAAISLLSLGPGIAKLAGTLIVVLVVALALSGATGLASIVGDGLSSDSDEGREWVRCLKGGVVLELAFLLPIFGWFFVLPLALFGGLGAAIAALVSKVEGLGMRRAESA